MCVVFSREARPEDTHRIPPPMAARFRHVSKADRSHTLRALQPVILSAVAKCRRFPDWTRSLPQGRPCAASAPVRESASLDTRTITVVNTSSRSPETSPAIPGSDCCDNPNDGI